jgi:hypothetical protein
MFIKKQFIFIFPLCSSTSKREIKGGEIYSSNSGIFSFQVPRDIIFLVQTQEKVNIRGEMKKMSIEELEDDLFFRGVDLAQTIKLN